MVSGVILWRNTATLPYAPAVPGQAKKERFYRPELDLLRFGAFSLVFLSHWIPYKIDSPRPWLALRLCCAFGVPVFFALSAFLITELLVREKQSTGTISLRSFYVRRVLRIWPLYFLALFCGFFLARAFGMAIFPTSALVANLFLVGNLYALHYQTLPLGLNVLWSIGVEEQFYLLLPGIAKICSRKALLAVAVSAWLVSQLGLVWMCTHHYTLTMIRFHTLTHIQYFALGAIVSILLHGRRPTFPAMASLAMLAAGLGLFYGVTYFCKVDAVLDSFAGISTVLGYLLVGCGTVLILLAALGTRVKPASYGVYLGRISYGLYVYHLVCLGIVLWFADSVLHMHRFRAPLTLVLGLSLTILVSTLSYKFFETPFLRLKKRFEIVASREI
jgi:peptidoglycan/LPS O-acetylase OafA/YrhL